MWSRFSLGQGTGMRPSKGCVPWDEAQQGVGSHREGCVPWDEAQQGVGSHVGKGVFQGCPARGVFSGMWAGRGVFPGMGSGFPGMGQHGVCFQGWASMG